MEPDSQPQISVVIATYNGQETLPTQLLALERQDFEGRFEVLICDNGSSDRTRDVAREWENRLPGIRVIDASDLAGGGFAKNVGVINALAPLIAFCDQDDYVLAGWLSAIHGGLAAHDIVTGPLGRVTDFGGTDPLPIVAETDFSQEFARLKGMPVAAGCNSGFTREALSQGFADMDTITSLRAHRRGFTVGWCPEAKILYRRPIGGPKLGRAISSGAWRAAIDREFGGGLNGESVRTMRSIAWLVFHLPPAIVRRDLASLRWPFGVAIGGILERTLPGYWWGRIGARRLAGKADTQVFLPESAR